MTKSLNLSGKKFGKLTALRISKHHTGKRAWLCKCDCGNKKVVTTNSLRQGNTSSCGCIKLESGHWRFIDRTDRRYGKLIAKRINGRQGKNILWECICDCGKTITVSSGHLGTGHTKSCGCMFYEKIALPYGESAFRSVLSIYKKRKDKFNIPVDVFRKMINDNCFYCGNPPSNLISRKGSLNGTLKYNGLDRVNNSKGYTLDNVVTCCINCNRAKRDMTQKEFIDMCSRVYKIHCVLAHS